jgi:hypothetical protein
MPDDVARAPAIADVGRVGPRFRQADEQRAEHVRGARQHGRHLGDETGHANPSSGSARLFL